MLGHTQMEASMTGGTPKWVVFTENPIKFDDLGVPVCQENPTLLHSSTVYPFIPHHIPLYAITSP